MKDQLIFDTTDANTIADSDSVGAYIRSSDGTQITHSTVGGKEALDVSIADGVNVEVDLSHLDDSVRLGDGTDFFTSTSENGDVALDVHLSNTSIAVTATDLDIRDLVFATDKVDVSGSTILGITNDVNIADGGNSITVDAVDLDIRDLQFATDEVQIGNATGVADFNTGVTTAQTLRVALATDTVLNINDAALADTAIANAANALGVANTAEDVVASPLANRKYLSIYNNGNRKIYVGASGVSSADGFPLSPGSYMDLRAGASVDVEWVGPNTNQEIRTLELS